MIYVIGLAIALISLVSTFFVGQGTVTPPSSVTTKLLVQSQLAKARAGMSAAPASTLSSAELSTSNSAWAALGHSTQAPTAAGFEFYVLSPSGAVAIAPNPAQSLPVIVIRAQNTAGKAVLRKVCAADSNCLGATYTKTDTADSAVFKF